MVEYTINVHGLPILKGLFIFNFLTRKLGEIKLVIFDMDGTLIDPRIDVANALNVSLTHFNLPHLSYQEIFGMIQNGMKNLMEQALPSSHLPCLQEAASVYRSHYDQHLLDNTTLYPSVRETLDALDHGRKRWSPTNGKNRCIPFWRVLI
jgi:phosphoglycolate phosphatase